MRTRLELSASWMLDAGDLAVPSGVCSFGMHKKMVHLNVISSPKIAASKGESLPCWSSYSALHNPERSPNYLFRTVRCRGACL